MRDLLNLEALLRGGDYVWESLPEEGIRILRHVIFCSRPVSNHYQSMNIIVPAAYVREDGSIDRNARVSGYTADTAPVIFRNSCSGWMSSDPDSDRSAAFSAKDVAESGYVYVCCGARSRDLGRIGKMPAPVIDLKAGIRFLRRNASVLPGCMDRIISIGGSGAGEMSSVIGATGNHPDYLPYLEEISAAMDVRDDVFGCMCYYPIADIENADLAYAWLRFDSGEASVTLGGGGQHGHVDFSEFQLALQQDMSRRFAEYVNELQLKDEDGTQLTFARAEDGGADPRKGSYYEKILANLSDALNAFLAREADPAAWIRSQYTADGMLPDWLTIHQGQYRITDLDGFLAGTHLARNKDIPGFDTFWKTAENNGFGGGRDTAVHYSRETGALLAANRERYAQLSGFEACDVPAYIREPEDETVREQTRLMNATHLLLENARKKKLMDPAPFWRIRSGTADEHTSFSVGYNLALAARENAGVQADYHLVWNMRHGGEMEGSSTGTFRKWVEGLLQ